MSDEWKDVDFSKVEKHYLELMGLRPGEDIYDFVMRENNLDPRDPASKRAAKALVFARLYGVTKRGRS